MKLIEFNANAKTYFINPAQIRHIECREGDIKGSYVSIYFSEDSQKSSLHFTKESANELIQKIRAA